MKFTVHGHYDVDVDTFWEQVFFNDDFINVLYQEGGMFESFRVINESVGPDGKREKTVEAKPALSLPKVLKAHLGDGIVFFEEGKFDPSRKIWRTQLRIPQVGDRISIQTVMHFENTGPQQCERTVEFDLRVNLFGVGKLVERFIQKTLVDSYEHARIITNQWTKANL